MVITQQVLDRCVAAAQRRAEERRKTSPLFPGAQDSSAPLGLVAAVR